MVTLQTNAFELQPHQRNYLAANVPRYIYFDTISNDAVQNTQHVGPEPRSLMIERFLKCAFAKGRVVVVFGPLDKGWRRETNVLTMKREID